VFPPVPANPPVPNNCIVLPTAYTDALAVAVTTGSAYATQFPLTCGGAQLEVLPVKLKLLIVPSLPLPLESITVVTVGLFAFTKPWLNLK